MEALFGHNSSSFDNPPASFSDPAREVKFRKDTLIEELLSLGHAKITPQIAKLIGDEVEKEIHRKKIASLSMELISELVEEKLSELGLIKSKKASEEKPAMSLVPVNQELFPEVLEVMAPSDSKKNEHPSGRRAPSFTEVGFEYLRRHFLIKNESGEVVETVEALLTRVARAIAAVDIRYSPSDDLESIETDFYNLMAAREFLPAPSILANAGRALSVLSNSFTIPVQDTMESIFEAMKQTAIVHKMGGSTGFSFNNLRPKKDNVKSTHGFSSGPVSFMKVYNQATTAVQEGGKNSGINRGLLHIDHPDILEFLSAQEGDTPLTHFALSVGMTSFFMKAVERDESYALVNPRSGDSGRSVKAGKVFQSIARHIFENAQPSLVFCDRMESANPTPLKGPISTLEPISEQPLQSFETLHYGSINLASVVEQGKIQWEKLKRIVGQAVHFLDNAIEADHYPLPEIEEAVKANRKIAVSVMGWADLLVKLKIPYASFEAETLAGQLMSFIQNEAQHASMLLGKKRGAFPNHDNSVFADRGFKRRNALVTAIVPANILALLANCAPGLEPLPYLATVLKTENVREFKLIQPDFEANLKKESILTESFLERLQEENSLASFEEIPTEMRNYFVTLNDVPAESLLKTQAVFQNYAENNVVQRIPLPATEEEVVKLIALAYHMGLKSLSFKPRGLIFSLDSDWDKNLFVPKLLDKSKHSNSLPIHENREVLKGFTRRLKTACGEVTLTLNETEAGLCEVLSRLEKSNSCSSAPVEALSRLVSLSLRYGVPAETIAEELHGISCPEHRLHGEDIPASVPEAFAKVLS